MVHWTPWNDSEFSTPGDQGEQGRMDLLAVLLHEISHLLGYQHTEDGLIDAMLAAGIRETPTELVDQCLAGT